MNRTMNIRRGVAVAIAGAGLAVSGLGIASAADQTSSDNSSPTAGTAADIGAERGNRHGGPGHGDGSRFGPELAEALGVSEDDLRSALDAVRDQLEPPADWSAPPTDEQLEERRGQMIASLAAELDLTDAEVSAAFDEVQQERMDERRTAMDERLDDAVTAGDLTTEDRISVLKAFDAGVFGGGPH